MKRKSLILKSIALLDKGASDSYILCHITNPLSMDFDSKYYENILNVAKRYVSIYK